ncbi:signal transduction histidine kinase [Streptomyces sp. Amel2xB2]|uniref:sensor histidine kinase n=1 Tax=Streptomyces sp. Amel2xB2 TaxID=1305829 RepID=UPI000DBFE530|nr:ATP-binding protein [Streptomyces sp. Amel2xB2]RAJ65669.1 signal transduction histidine kinase [Streptomyces sp. Amel2xB2]
MPGPSSCGAAPATPSAPAPDVPPVTPPPAQGSVEARFLASAHRLAPAVRGVAVVVISVFGLLGVPDEAVPMGFAVFGLVLAGAAVDCCAGFTGRGAALSPVLAVLRVVAVCAVQEWTGGPANLWALNVLTTTAITLQWEWSPAVTVPVTAGLLAVELAAAGTEVTGTLVPRLLFECLLARLGFVLLRQSGRRVDELRERRSALALAEAVSLARHRKEREYLALLHDTAASTFLLVTVQGTDMDPEQVAEYARRDLAVLTGTAGGATDQDSPVDLTASLRTVVGAGGRLSVDVHADEVPLVPASVALAFVRAVREALVNVERHAGVGTATLSVRGEGDRVVVVVADSGVGFQPEQVARSRRGIRGSVVERMAAVGGGATVTSRPGAGTGVRMVWPGE